jgi:hypothetical protein
MARDASSAERAEMDQTGGAEGDPNTTTIGDPPGDETMARTGPGVKTAVQRLGTASASTLDALNCSSSS